MISSSTPLCLEVRVECHKLNSSMGYIFSAKEIMLEKVVINVNVLL